MTKYSYRRMDNALLQWWGDPNKYTIHPLNSTDEYNLHIQDVVYDDITLEWLCFLSNGQKCRVQGHQLVEVRRHD